MRVFIGVAWPYANGPIHLGHMAGALLPADIFARYQRMQGNESTYLFSVLTATSLAV